MKKILFIIFLLVLIIVPVHAIDGVFPIINAVVDGDYAKVKEMLKEEKDKDIKTQALSSAVVNYKKDIIKLLVNNGADVNGKNGSILWWASYSGQIDTVKLLIQNGADVNLYDDNSSPLMATSKKEIAEMLIKNGADVNFQREFDGQTVLIFHSYVGSNDKDIIELLIKNGAKVNVQDNDCKTALDYADNRKDFQVIKLLNENGAKYGKEFKSCVKK